MFVLWFMCLKVYVVRIKKMIEKWFKRVTNFW